MNVNDFEARFSRRAGTRVAPCCKAVHNFAGAVGGPVVDRDYLIIAVIESEQTLKRLLNGIFFVAGRDDDGNMAAAVACELAVPFWLRNVRHRTYAAGSVHDPREPNKGQKTACDPVKKSHP